MTSIPTDLQWQIIRRNSCFLRRQRGINKHFSTEPFNIMGINSIRYNGLVHKNAMEIRPIKSGKGIQIVTKISKNVSKPSKSTSTVMLKSNARKSLKSIRNITKSYRKSLSKIAQRRASQILRSQKPIASRQGRRARKFKTEL